jgi:replicative DNA helicase
MIEPDATQLVNAQLEQSLLGALLAEVRLVEHIPAELHAEHFAVDGHGTIYDAIIATAQRQRSGAVALVVGNAIGADAGGHKYVGELVAAAVGFTPDIIRNYTGAVIDLARRRHMLEVIDAARADIARPDHPIGAALAPLLDAADAPTTLSGAGRSIMIGEAIDDALRAADDAAKREGPTGVSTGFPSVDRALGGLEAGALVVLGGRPSMGKSALGWQFAIAAARQGVGVLAVSLEMSARELGRRALSVAAGVPIGRLKRGEHAGDMAKVIAARKELYGLPIWIEDGGGLTAATIRLRARAAHRRHGIGLIVVDHLHIVAPDAADARNGATWAVGRISGAMKRLAKELQVPVLLLAQLNRGVEGREDKRPTLADLRQAGEIEQDADVVALLYRHEYYLSRTPPEQQGGEGAERYSARIRDWHDARERLAGKAELILAKIRDGEPQTVVLRFDGPTASFHEPAATGEREAA